MKQNSRYSMRAFAKKLGLSPGGLSQILARKKKLSLVRAHEIAETLDLSDSEKKEFLLLVQFESSKNESARAHIYNELQSCTTDNQFSLELENFHFISEWYGFAILQMISTFAKDWNGKKISQYLGVPQAEVELMIDRMMHLELIERTKNGYQRAVDRIVERTNTPNEAMHRYHESVLTQAQQSVRKQTPAERFIGTEVFAFDHSDLDEIKKVTDQYLNQLLKIAKKGTERTEMYQVCTAFFRLNPALSKRSTQ